MSADTVRMAQAIAKNRNWPVFPCRANKYPATPARPGGMGGFHFASTDPDEIANSGHNGRVR